MSVPMVPDRGDRAAIRWRRRPPALLAIAAASVLALLPPRRIRQLLITIRRGAGPATAEQALAARQAVTALSLRCAGEGCCLQRSIATALLCRIDGVWPDWCTGVRTSPFRAHAWVEVDGNPIGEPRQSAGYYRTLMAVRSRAARTPGRSRPNP